MIAIVKELRADPSRTVIAEAINVITQKFPRDANVAASLALILSKSGSTFSKRASDSADVASTGGPTSLSTLPAIFTGGGFAGREVGSSRATSWWN